MKRYEVTILETTNSQVKTFPDFGSLASSLSNYLNGREALMKDRQTRRARPSVKSKLEPNLDRQVIYAYFILKSRTHVTLPPFKNKTRGW